MKSTDMHYTEHGRLVEQFGAELSDTHEIFDEFEFELDENGYITESDDEIRDMIHSFYENDVREAIDLLKRLGIDGMI